MKRGLGLFLAGILVMSTFMACGTPAETDQQDLLWMIQIVSY